MQKFKKVFVAGTFDKFHLGHQFFLWEAQERGEEIVIVIARDITVEKIKGIPPQNSEEKRLKRIQKEHITNASLRLGRVDRDFFETIREESPDMLFLGYDQNFDEKKAKEEFPALKIMRCSEYKPEFFKSSKFR